MYTSGVCAAWKFPGAENEGGILTGFVRIYDRLLQPVGEIDNIDSMVIERDFFGTGSFELHIGHQKGIFEMLEGKGFLLYDNRPDRAFIPRDIHITDDGASVIVKGVSLLGVFEQRVIVPPAGQNYLSYTYIGAETVMHSFIRAQCMYAEDERRNIGMLKIYPASGLGGYISWRASYDQTLAEVLYEIGAYTGLGHKMDLEIDSGNMTYRVMPGKDLSAENGNNPPVVFSAEFENIASASYIKKGSGYKNAVYAISGDIGRNEHMVYVSREDDVKGLDLTEEAVKVNASAYSDLVWEGNRRLTKVMEENRITAQILDTNSFRYEKDWDLGDIVTIVHRLAGKAMHERITKIREIHENSGLSLELTFGLSDPEFKQRIESLERKVRIGGL